MAKVDRLVGFFIALGDRTEKENEKEDKKRRKRAITRLRARGAASNILQQNPLVQRVLTSDTGRVEVSVQKKGQKPNEETVVQIVTRPSGGKTIKATYSFPQKTDQPSRQIVEVGKARTTGRPRIRSLRAVIRTLEAVRRQ